MIACCPLSRVDRLWIVARLASALSNRQLYSQGCFFHYNLNCVTNMGKAKDGSNSLNRHNKRKAVVSVWRPVSTESGSHEVYVAKELENNPRDSYEAVGCSERSNVGCQVHEGHNNMSSCVSGSQTFSQDEPNAGVIVSLASSASNLNYDNHSEDLKAHPVSFSCDMENLPETFDCRTISESEKAIHKGQVKEESLLVSVSETGAELANKVAKHSVPLEVAKGPNLDYSHFISLPLSIYPELVEKLDNFQNTILGGSTSGHDGNSDSDSSENSSDDGKGEGKQSEDPNIAVKLEVEGAKENVTMMIDTNTKSAILTDLGVEKSIFIKPKTFHLTVLMLKLWNKDRIAAAAEILKKISSKVNDALDNRPVSIKLKGLEIMRGSPAKARVLYAPVKEIGGEGRLLRACQVIIEAYVEAGLVLEKDARQALKLHATLMNARHRKRKKGTKRQDSFDARWILRRFGSEEWGDYVLREAHLSQRFSFNQSGYYRCCASIPFPDSMETE